MKFFPESKLHLSGIGGVVMVEQEHLSCVVRHPRYRELFDNGFGRTVDRVFDDDAVQ